VLRPFPVLLDCGGTQLVANLNRRFNSIELLFVNGSVSFDQHVIRDHLV
jgi:hypothetical protein